MNRVFVVTIHHKHGEDLRVQATEEGARNAILEYVKEFWSEWQDADEGDDDYSPIPEDREEAISEYFSLAEESEYYEIDELPVGE